MTPSCTLGCYLPKIPQNLRKAIPRNRRILFRRCAENQLVGNLTPLCFSLMHFVVNGNTALQLGAEKPRLTLTTSELKIHCHGTIFSSSQKTNIILMPAPIHVYFFNNNSI